MTNEELKVEFEAFITRQTTQSKDVSLTQMMATPYGHRDGNLAAAFHLFKFGYDLGRKQNV